MDIKPVNEIGSDGNGFELNWLPHFYKSGGLNLFDVLISKVGKDGKDDSPEPFTIRVSTKVHFFMRHIGDKGIMLSELRPDIFDSILVIVHIEVFVDYLRSMQNGSVFTSNSLEK